MNLDGLAIGTKARILTVGGAPDLAQRLLEMGMLEGDEIEVIAIAPLGDPLEVRLGDSRLSLRRAEAAFIEVELLS